MPGRGYLQSLTHSCTLAALFCASSLVAEQAGTAPAYPGSGAPATTVATGQKTSSPTVGKTTAKTGPKTPKITDVKFLEFLAPKAERLYGHSKGKLHHVFQTVKFRMAILGENLACNEETKVFLETKNPGEPPSVGHCSPRSQKEIHVSGEARVGTVITTVKVTEACTAGNDQGNAVKGQGDAADDQAEIPTPTPEGKPTPDKEAALDEKLLISMKCPAKSGAEASKGDAAVAKCTAVSTGLTISIKPI